MSGISLDDRPVVRELVAVGGNAPVEAITGNSRPVNRSRDAGEDPWIAGNKVPGDCWVAATDARGGDHADSVSLSGSLNTAGAEATGICSVRDAQTRFRCTIPPVPATGHS